MADPTPLVKKDSESGKATSASRTAWKLLTYGQRWKRNSARSAHPVTKYGDLGDSGIIHVASIDDITSNEEKPCLKLSPLVRSSLFVASFMLVGTVIGGMHFGWSTSDSIYFSATTLMTVGYGDFSFGAEAGDIQLLGAAFVMFGVFVVGVALANVFDAAMEAENHAVERHVAKQSGAQGMESASGLGYAKQLYGQAKHRLQWNLQIALVEMVIVLLGGAFAVAYLEGWDWRTGIYWSCVTLSTVGYGDVTPQTTAGRLCATVLMLSGVLIVGNGAGFLASYRTSIREVKARKAVLTQFGVSLTASELNTLARGEEIRSLGLCQSMDFVSRSEFCMYMLVKLGRVSKEELLACQDAFDCLDLTKSGRLEKKDLEMHVQRQEALGNL